MNDFNEAIYKVVRRIPPGRVINYGRLAMLEVTLQPGIRFGGERLPQPEEVAHLHHEAHEACYLAQSVKTVVRVPGV